jgi:aspartokinase/homoserine dehydrogenase 1
MSAGLRVLKFGGSSLAGSERFERARSLIAEASRESPLAVVVSALGDTTDDLLSAAARAEARDVAGAHELVEAIAATGRASTTSAAPRTRQRLDEILEGELTSLRQQLDRIAAVGCASAVALDEVVSHGELISARLLAESLRGDDVDARFVDSRDWTVTDDSFGQARVDRSAARERVASLRPGWGSALTVHTGFLGRTPAGRTTTLGRNGSDYTAALLAQFLGAAELVRWTDVSGIMTADPRLVHEAYPVRRLSYDEALELANLGAKVLHPRTVGPLVEAGIPLRIRNSLQPQDPGTLIDAFGNSDENHPTCVTSQQALALLSIEWKRSGDGAPIGERVLAALNTAAITVWVAVQSPHGRALALVVSTEALARAESVVRRELQAELASGEVGDLAVRSPVTLLTLVAEAMGRTVGVAGRFFGALGGVGINVRASGQGAGSRSISAVIDEVDTPSALRTVHAAFNLAHQELSVFVLGKGIVGSQLLAQIESQRSTLLASESVNLKLVGLADSRNLIFSENGLEVKGHRERLKESARSGSDLLHASLDELRRLPAPVLVDCTAEEGMERVYAEAFNRGIHVVAANKKPLTLPWAERQALLALARRAHRAYHYETTVGASLPVIETLKNLVRTGDRVHLIEGSLSGTLGFLCAEVMKGVPLSEAVRDARERGFTEPRPQDDLSGLDAARKALILARELALPLELGDVVVEPLVAREVLALRDVEDFLRELRRRDRSVAEQVVRYRDEGKELRYLARIEPDGATPRVRVGAIAVDDDHPAARLRGSEAVVSFTTERYREYPLVVQGAGAGGAVTAAGVLADVLRVAQTLRGR